VLDTRCTLSRALRRRSASSIQGWYVLSKGYGLINRFSEDIDITAFREDLDQAASPDELEGMSGKKRRAKLDAIRDACQAWVKGALRDGVSARIAEAVEEAGRVEIDNTDPDGQTEQLQKTHPPSSHRLCWGAGWRANRTGSRKTAGCF